jgi:hypothetical protein
MYQILKLEHFYFPQLCITKSDEHKKSTTLERATITTTKTISLDYDVMSQQISYTACDATIE